MRLATNLLILAFLSLCPCVRAQTLVYSLTYADTAASRRARFPSPMPFGRTEAENLAILRNTRRTEIYSLSLADGKRSLLFSDDGMNLEIKSTGAVSRDGKAFMAGTFREYRMQPHRTVVAQDAIYEIPLDGSNRFRKITDLKPNQPPALLNAQGTKAAYENYGTGFVLSVYAVPEWKFLHTSDLSKLIETHCAACTPVSCGWLADGNRLYLELTVAGDYDKGEVKNDIPGIYLISDDGAELGLLSPSIGALQMDGYVHPKQLEHHLLAQLPDGTYVFEDYAYPKGAPFSNPTAFLVLFNPATNARKQFPLKFSIGSGFLSPSGKYLAYMESRPTRDYRSEQHLWVKNLDSGEEKELFSVPPPNPPSSPEPNVAIFILGWLD